MEKIKWIIDKYLFDEYEERLVTAIKKSGAYVYFYDDTCGEPFKDWVMKRFNDTEIVIFHGSLQHGKIINKLPLYPSTFMTIENYECYKYYGFYGNELLNRDYMMMGLNDVVRNKFNITKFVSEKQYPIAEDLQKRLFIRPSNGYKTFPGQFMRICDLEREVNTLLKSYGGDFIDPTTLVLISKYQKITEEYRFIVIDNEVISGSLYLDEHNMKTLKPYYNRLCTDEKAKEYAIKVSKLYTPDFAYTLDICKTVNGEFKVLEINSFNCASMYGNDYDLVVESINKLAIKEYNNLFKV